MKLGSCGLRTWVRKSKTKRAAMPPMVESQTQSANVSTFSAPAAVVSKPSFPCSGAVWSRSPVNRPVGITPPFTPGSSFTTRGPHTRKPARGGAGWGQRGLRWGGRAPVQRCAAGKSTGPQPPLTPIGTRPSRERPLRFQIELRDAICARWARPCRGRTSLKRRAKTGIRFPRSPARSQISRSVGRFRMIARSSRRTRRRCGGDRVPREPSPRRR